MILERKADPPATTSCETSLSNVAKFYTRSDLYRFAGFRASDAKATASRDASSRRKVIVVARTETWRLLEKYIIACK